MASYCPRWKAPLLAMSFFMATAATMVTPKEDVDAICLIQRYKKHRPRVKRRIASPLDKKLQEALKDPAQWQRHGVRLRKTFAKLFKDAAKLDINKEHAAILEKTSPGGTQILHFRQELDKKTQQLEEAMEDFHKLNMGAEQLQGVRSTKMEAGMNEFTKLEGGQSPLAVEYQKLQKYASVAYEQNQQMLQAFKQFKAEDEQMEDQMKVLQAEKSRTEADVKKMFEERHQNIIDNQMLKKTWLEMQKHKQRLEAETAELQRQNKEFQEKTVQLKQNITNILKYIHQIEDYAGKAYSENKQLRVNIMDVNKGMDGLKVSVQQRQKERDKWQSWLNNLVDWNKKLKFAVQGDFPDKMKVQMQEAINKISEENAHLREDMDKDNMTLSEIQDELQARHKEMQELDNSNKRLLGEKEKIKMSYLRLQEEQLNIQRALDNATVVSGQQKDTIDRFHQFMDEAKRKAVDENVELQKELSGINAQKSKDLGELKRFEDEQKHFMQVEADPNKEKENLQRDELDNKTAVAMELEKTKQLEDELKHIQGEKQQVEAGKTDLEKNMTGLENQLAQISGSNQEMLEANNRLKDQNTNLEEQLSSLTGNPEGDHSPIQDEKNTKIKEDIKRFTEEIGQLEEHLQETDQRKTDLQAKINAITGENERLQAEGAKPGEEKAPQSQQAAESERDNHLKSEFDRLKKENKAIRSQLWENFGREQRLLDGAKQVEQEEKELEDTIAKDREETEALHQGETNSEDTVNVVELQLKDDITKLEDSKTKLLAKNKELSQDEDKLKDELETLMARKTSPSSEVVPIVSPSPDKTSPPFEVAPVVNSSPDFLDDDASWAPPTDLLDEPASDEHVDEPPEANDISLPPSFSHSMETAPS